MKINEVALPKDVDSITPVRKKKTDPNSDIDSMVAVISGNKSAYFTKLARRFDRASRLKKLLAAEEKKLKAEAMQSVDEIFAASDAVYTRIIETVSLVFKISKESEKTVDKLDGAGYLMELEKLSGLAVNELENLRKTYSSAVTTVTKSRVLAPKQKTISEGIDLGAIKQFASRILAQVTSHLANWDNKFSTLKQKIDLELQ